MPCADERLVNRRGPNRGGYIVLRLLITLAGPWLLLELFGRQG
jgi:hypothetical protein